MRLVDFLASEDVLADMQAADKRAALAEMAEVLARRHTVSAGAVLDVLAERERLASTGIGDGVAIPHGRLAGVRQLFGAMGRSRRGVAFDSVDGRETHLFFALLAPENSTGLHLKALARISSLVKNAGLRQRLVAAETGEEMFRLLSEEDARHAG